MFNKIKAYFIKDVDALLGDFNKVVKALEARAAVLTTEGTQLALAADDAFTKAAKASNVSTKIKQLIS